MRKQITEDRIPDTWKPNQGKTNLNGRKPPRTLRRSFQSRYDNDVYFRSMVDMAAIMVMAFAALLFFYTVLTW